MNNLKLTDEERVALVDSAKLYDIITGNPYRCDFCDYPCDCDEQTLSLGAEEIFKKFPRLREWTTQIKSFIYDW